MLENLRFIKRCKSILKINAKNRQNGFKDGRFYLKRYCQIDERYYHKSPLRHRERSVAIPEQAARDRHAPSSLTMTYRCSILFLMRLTILQRRHTDELSKQPRKIILVVKTQHSSNFFDASIGKI